MPADQWIGILCWPSRKFLMTWTEICTTFTIIFIIVNFTTQQWDFCNGLHISLFLNSVIIIAVCVFLFVATALEKLILLKLGFFLVLGSIVLIAASCTISILYVTKDLGHLYFTRRRSDFAVLGVFYALQIVTQALLTILVWQSVRDLERKKIMEKLKEDIEGFDNEQEDD